VQAVATAFRDGEYNGKTYSGGYGDLSATISAIMLDREARASILDSDPTHGQMREPLLKVLHMMKAMEFETENDMEFLMLHMDAKIGQDGFRQPTAWCSFCGRLFSNTGLSSPVYSRLYILHQILPHSIQPGT
jgi:uncharacterized protein (DUF1800 family)